VRKTTIVHVGREHINQSGYVGYLDLLILLDTGQDSFLKNTVGIDFDKIESRWGLLLTVKTVHIDFSAKGTGYLHEGDELSINTGIESVDDRSFAFVQTTAKDKDLICTSTLMVELCDQEGKPARIPSELRQLLMPSA